MHEIGHNLGLDHAGEGSDGYGDKSGMVRTLYLNGLSKDRLRRRDRLTAGFLLSHNRWATHMQKMTLVSRLLLRLLVQTKMKETFSSQASSSHSTAMLQRCQNLPAWMVFF